MNNGDLASRLLSLSRQCPFSLRQNEQNKKGIACVLAILEENVPKHVVRVNLAILQPCDGAFAENLVQINPRS